MTQRYDPYKGEQNYVQGMVKTEEALAASPLDAKLRHLIKLRVSQINGCAYCVTMHLKEARGDNETQQRLDHLAVWREVEDFTPAERAALNWAELLTHLPQTRELDSAFGVLEKHFNAEEIRAINFSIVMINAWNRLAVGAHGRHLSADAPLALAS